MATLDGSMVVFVTKVDRTLLCLLALVRQKAKEINSFLQDEDRLREARKTAKQNRDKYVGYSSEQAGSKYSELLSWCMCVVCLACLCIFCFKNSSNLHFPSETDQLLFWSFINPQHACA